METILLYTNKNKQHFTLALATLSLAPPVRDRAWPTAHAVHAARHGSPNGTARHKA
jgi:hypothetical protein